MNFMTWMTVMYEIATRTLSRVTYRGNRGVIGLVIQQDKLARTIQVHWGFDNGKPIWTWHDERELIPVPMITKEMSNGH